MTLKQLLSMYDTGTPVLANYNGEMQYGKVDGSALQVETSALKGIYNPVLLVSVVFGDGKRRAYPHYAISPKEH